MSRMLTQQNCQVPDTVDRIFKKMRFNLNIDEKYLNICSYLLSYDFKLFKSS